MKSVSSVPLSRMVVLFATCLYCTAVPSSAQQAASVPPSQEQVNQQLIERLQELEEEVRQLKAQQGGGVATATPVAPPPPPAPAAPTPAPTPAPAPAPEVTEVNEVAPRLQMIVFGDVGTEMYNHIPDTFLFGSMDIFMTARLSDKFSTLGELLFLANNDNTISVDVERLWLRYRQSQYFTASIGRYHTWVGYYNSTYNKGEYLETTTDRPFMYAFDDDGGVLPMQEVGVNLTGQIPSGGLGLNYVLEVGNGGAWGINTEPAQSNQDANNSKSINGGLFARPKKYRGLQLGFSLRHDNLSIPAPEVHETIATTHAVFNNGKYEILNEGVLVRHVEASGPVFTTDAFYTQWSRSFHGKYRPYFRYQYFNAPSNDPVYMFAGPNDFAPPSVNGFVGRVNGPSVGIRYDFIDNAAFKLQYDRISERQLPDVNGLTTQVAFTF
jgi:hypothetical protein